MPKVDLAGLNLYLWWIPGKYILSSSSLCLIYDSEISFYRSSEIFFGIMTSPSVYCFTYVFPIHPWIGYSAYSSNRGEFIYLLVTFEWQGELAEDEPKERPLDHISFMVKIANISSNQGGKAYAGSCTVKGYFFQGVWIPWVPSVSIILVLGLSRVHYFPDYSRSRRQTCCWIRLRRIKRLVLAKYQVVVNEYNKNYLE